MPEIEEITGSITVQATEEPLNITLVGSAETWSAEGQSITLSPGDHPIHYKLTLTPESSERPLVGVRFFLGSGEAKIFIPADSGDVELNLINAVSLGDPAISEVFSIGVQLSFGVHWFEPSIAFDPQAGPQTI
ncbi:MAG TPA: hypothetical protein VEW48_20670 [Thermoanaerobaculia bacterium]|nr:hypothetical protein [Thermoanaerobaculia bacterium]